jgi:hypothetical protein
MKVESRKQTKEEKKIYKKTKERKKVVENLIRERNV